MSVTPEETSRIAALAKLRLEGDELSRLTRDFNGILDFVQQIREVDTSSVEPVFHVLDLEDVRRDDIPSGELSEDEIRNLAVKFEAGFFVVPQVIETE